MPRNGRAVQLDQLAAVAPGSARLCKHGAVPGVNGRLSPESEGEMMTDDRGPVVPVWALATNDVRVPALSLGGPMTAERLGDLRSALAVLARQPIATLEVHPLPDKLDRSRGIHLDAVSPLAQHLSQLITQSARSSSVVATATSSGEGLYRMVIPAKVAAQVGQGVVRSMPSKAVAGGIHSALAGSRGIVAHATFVPVGEVAAAGAVGGGAGAAAGMAAAGSAALTVAAPLVLMAVAVGDRAHPEGGHKGDSRRHLRTHQL